MSVSPCSGLIILRGRHITTLEAWLLSRYIKVEVIVITYQDTFLSSTISSDSGSQ